MKVRIAEQRIQIIPLKKEEYSLLNLNRDYIDLMEE
jgi:homoserine O-succinyltransferase